MQDPLPSENRPILTINSDRESSLVFLLDELREHMVAWVLITELIVKYSFSP